MVRAKSFYLDSQTTVGKRFLAIAQWKMLYWTGLSGAQQGIRVIFHTSAKQLRQIIKLRSSPIIVIPYNNR